MKALGWTRQAPCAVALRLAAATRRVAAETRHKSLCVLCASVPLWLGLAGSLHAQTPSPAAPAPAAAAPDLAAEIQALKARLAELERKENQDWMTAERLAQVKAIVNECLADARTRGPLADAGLAAGYKDGFFIRSEDGKFKLLVGGYAQVRYVYADYNLKNRAAFDAAHTDPFATGQNDPGSANGFELRRARLNFSGNAFTEDLFFKFEGDFAGANSNAGNFQITDAYVGYRVTDWLKFKGGAYKVPFLKSELTADPLLGMMERPDVSFPFDPVRSVGVGVFGDIIRDTLAYEVMVNNGSKANTVNRIDDTAVTANLDNHLGFYGRLAWAGAGKVADFADESDLRDPKKADREFIWLSGVAAGYESQNATTTAFPHGQNTTLITGASSDQAPGFLAGAPLNGDVYRATVDWSAKWQGWSFLTAVDFQQINQNPGAFSLTTTPLPTGFRSSFSELGYYGQVGYMIVPRRWEIVGRVGQLLTCGLPNRAEYYTVGANYYVFGNNAKVLADVTYVPEAAFTDAASDQIINTHEVIYRLELQIKF